jgi:hypothetical protein
MPRIVITAQVEASKQWEKGFRTHKKLFKRYTATAIHYTATADNEVAIVMRVKNLQKFLDGMQLPETAEAMAFDGVKRDTVKQFLLDKKLEF